MYALQVFSESQFTGQCVLVLCTVEIKVVEADCCIRVEYAPMTQFHKMSTFAVISTPCSCLPRLFEHTTVIVKVVWIGKVSTVANNVH